ncbi:MAG: M48 family metalloprotease [Pseudomonadota bacterium]
MRRSISPQTFTTALLAALLSAGIASAQNGAASVELPEMGEPADLTLSPSQENRIGDQVASELYRGDYGLNDVELSDYINSMGWKLAAKGAVNPPNFRFFVIGDPRINAFAVPGGVIGINAGLMLNADNESELAGVVGHEQAHVTQRHLARTSNDTSVANLATWAAILAAIVAGSGNPDIILGGLALGQSVNYQREVNYTRSHEIEADRIGIRTMAEAGYDPEGMATFFAKLEQQSRLYNSQLPDILRTHPVNTVRIAEARTRAALLPKVTLKPNPEFDLMKARTIVLMATSPTAAIDEMGRRLSAGDSSSATQYGYALALFNAGRAADALNALKPVLVTLPRQLNVNLLQAQLLAATGKVDEGLALLDRTTRLNPRSAPAVIIQARALLDAGKPLEARQLLLSHEQAHDDTPETHRLLSEASRQLKNIGDAQYEMANYELARGDLRAALTQVDAGLRLSSLSQQDRARLQSQREQLIARIPKSVLADLSREQRRLGVR